MITMMKRKKKKTGRRRNVSDENRRVQSCANSIESIDFLADDTNNRSGSTGFYLTGIKSWVNLRFLPANHFHTLKAARLSLSHTLLASFLSSFLSASPKMYKFQGNFPRYTIRTDNRDRSIEPHRGRNGEAEETRLYLIRFIHYSIDNSRNIRAFEIIRSGQSRSNRRKKEICTNNYPSPFPNFPYTCATVRKKIIRGHIYNKMEKFRSRIQGWKWKHVGQHRFLERRKGKEQTVGEKVEALSSCHTISTLFFFFS